MVAIQHDAGSYESIEACGILDDARAVGGVYQGTRQSALAQCIERLLELRELFLGVCGLGIVCISEMCHEAFEPESGAKCWHGCEVRHFWRTHAQATHPGFDFDMHGVGRGLGRDGCGKDLDHIGSVQHGRQAMRDQVGKLCWDGRAHDQDGIMNARLAKHDALIHGGDTEPVDGQLLQRACEFECPMAIGIGLDDGQYLGVRCKAPHMGQIMPEGIQID
jgi:hypothetical protein